MLSCDIREAPDFARPRFYVLFRSTSSQSRIPIPATRTTAQDGHLAHSKRNTHLCQTRQIHQSQIEHVWAVYAEVNGELADALVLAGDAECLLLNLAANLVEVGVALVYVKELAPFGVVGWRVRDGGVDELEDEWSPGNDALAAGEEIASDDAR